MGPQTRHLPGGIVRIHAVLDAYEREIEFDLRAHCNGIDLRDLWRRGGGASKMTYRLLGVLIDGLPGHSAYKTAVRDSLSDEQLAELAKEPRDRHGVWSHTDLLIAALVDRIELLRRDVVAVNGGKVKGEFEPIPRPGVATRRRKALSAEGHAYLRRIREEHARANGYDPDTGAPVQQGGASEAG